MASRKGLSSAIFVALISMASFVSAMIAFSPYLFVSHDPNSIEFGATLSPSRVSVNQTVRLSVYDKNTLSLFEDKLPFNPAFSAEQNLSMGLCSTGPFGFVVFQGDYDLGNVTSAKVLWPFDPLASSLCPMSGLPGPTYTFEPNQNVSGSATFSGFYPGIKGDDAFHDFTPGEYTVLVGDAWNHKAILHFTVTG